jgi:hypothetical protein
MIARAHHVALESCKAFGIAVQQRAPGKDRTGDCRRVEERAIDPAEAVERRCRQGGIALRRLQGALPRRCDQTVVYGFYPPRTTRAQIGDQRCARAVQHQVMASLTQKPRQCPADILLGPIN